MGLSEQALYAPTLDARIRRRNPADDLDVSRRPDELLLRRRVRRPQTSVFAHHRRSVALRGRATIAPSPIASTGRWKDSAWAASARRCTRPSTRELFSAVVEYGGALATWQNLVQFNNAVAVEMYNAVEANFLPYSLWDLTTANAAALRSDVNYKMIVGDADSQYQSNVRFRDHLQSLGIDPQFQVLPGVEHVGGAYLSEGSGVRFLSEHFASVFRREGDYDRDGDVDTNDYDAWKTAFGSMTQLAADGNEDGVVDAADYVVWRKALNTSVMLTNETTRGMVTQADHGVLPANFGPTTGRGSAGSANATVPEPATALMLVVGILAMFSRRGAVMPSARQRMTPVDKPPSEHVF